MNNIKIIKNNLDFFFVKQDLFEPDEIFEKRTNYLKKCMNNNTETFDIIVKKSRIISNIQNMKCEYNRITMQKLTSRI